MASTSAMAIIHHHKSSIEIVDPILSMLDIPQRVD
jgi:hypothetical protein